jgi:hypothetical protein
MSELTSKKVFISYSWTTAEHQEWVIGLAKRLVSDGVDVVLDKWNLKEGNDLYDFMESMVKSEEISKVLIVLDKEYTEKADARKGGVGTETQIISPNIYNDVSQDKFVPIVREVADSGLPFIPTFLTGRVFIDLSVDDQFEENYESLLRNIYDKPSLSKPKIGKPPTYLFEETPLDFRTSQILRGLDVQIDKHPDRINSVVRDFLDDFYDNLKEFTVTFENRDSIDVGKRICERINQYTPLRDDFILFFKKLTIGELKFDIDILVNFMEKLPLLNSPQDNKGSWSSFEFDNFRFITHELLIYLVAIGIKNENYSFVEEVLYSSYFAKDKYKSGNEPRNFDVFYANVDIITAYYNQTHSKEFFSAMADFMIKRIPEFLSKELIVQADLLCHHVADLNDWNWFPQTYVYDTSNQYELFYRMVSKRHFEKVKVLFDVEDVVSFRAKLEALKKKHEGRDRRITYSRAFDSVTPLHLLIDIETLGTKR